MNSSHHLICLKQVTGQGRGALQELRTIRRGIGRLVLCLCVDLLVWPNCCCGALGRRATGLEPSISHNGIKLASPPAGFEFIDTSFENASPLWYDFAPDGTINVHLLYDN